MSNLSRVEELQNILAKRVRFETDDIKLMGTVVAVYIPHPCQKHEVKVFCDLTNKYYYRRLSDVKEVKTIKAYAYKDEDGGLRWFHKEFTGYHPTKVRCPEYDMEKEV